ncbi:hypothetical protein MAC_09514 [Metarhizium acridum CQMa 102]|uniref:Uncharacterized protein n=1 Tax=Metarhizium acridum (strain CQMa 102) TaxID=655827 RepID=E9EI16_METAQ|nr:uncharacterized protein MAC_09514 [Metarhizium acridum CQMa 102]EFY84436.1 hypothetical protein MAC_09514 [Metarhizium acridum CQMa 102]
MPPLHAADLDQATSGGDLSEVSLSDVYETTHNYPGGESSTVGSQTHSNEPKKNHDVESLNAAIHGHVSTNFESGRVDIELDSGLCRRLSYFIPSTPRQITKRAPSVESPPPYTEQGPESLRLNIVIQVVGSRGDVQPFVALGQELQRHHHRVRLASHDVFGKFVKDAGLEFFPVGGDPAELMAYMVKNPGLIPSMESLTSGDVQKKRKMVETLLRGFWSSCIQPDPTTSDPFVADAIIANPPSFAHIHCAQALGVPLHLMFTMPWTSTTAFCHPLANMHGESKTPPKMANYLSYVAVEWLTWQGLQDVINAWRRTLDLEPVPFSEGPCLAETLEIPFTYCWSPSLVPKPDDWPEHVDPEKLTQVIVQAVEDVGVRAIVSKGWSKLGQNQPESENIFYLGDCPHEWLFKHVCAVVHHGGAGTTACGLLNGRPTAIVPFFGDQPFWGAMVAAAGAGPEPIPAQQLNATNLANAIRFCLTPEAAEASEAIAAKMKSECGVRRAVASFHANLPLNKMRCDVVPSLPASWLCKNKGLQYRLSKGAAEILIPLESHPHQQSQMDPVTVAASSLATTGTGMVTSAANIVLKPLEVLGNSRAERKQAAVETGHVPKSASSDGDVYGRSAAIVLPKTAPDTTEDEKNAVAAAMIGSASGVGNFFKTFSKGMLLDLPLAVTEGLRNAPRLYGGQVYEPGSVTDWKSGGVVAAKSFSHGVVEGFRDLVMEPVRGAERGGVVGAIKGAGIGLANSGAKLSSGALGIVTYSGQGVYQSLRATAKRDTSKRVKEAIWAEGPYAVKAGLALKKDAVLEAFDAFVASKTTS